MTISVFDLFSIGIGPSSSHTVGPMRAARQFALLLEHEGSVASIKTELYGSLALTGKGHGTDFAALLGLEGETPEGVDPAKIKGRVAKIREEKALLLLGKKPLSYIEERDLLFHKDKFLPYHPNGIRFTAYDLNGGELLSKVYYSVGGGFIVEHEKISKSSPLVENTHRTKPVAPTSTTSKFASAFKSQVHRQDLTKIHSLN